MTFTGTDKLISGKQKISFSSLTEQHASSGMLVKVYEVIETAVLGMTLNCCLLCDLSNKVESTKRSILLM
jgi:hypothetical protein